MLEIIGTFISSFFNSFKGLIGNLAFKLFAAMGLSFVTYKAVLPQVKAYLAGYINQLPQQAATMVGVLGVDIAMVMVISALVVRVGSRTALKSVLPPT